MVITFKVSTALPALTQPQLETDVSILDDKVGVHLYKYGADLVIGNILGQHASRVCFYQDGVEKKVIEHTEEDKQNSIDIEKKMIMEISKRYDEWKAKQSK